MGLESSHIWKPPAWRRLERDAAAVQVENSIDEKSAVERLAKYTATATNLSKGAFPMNFCSTLSSFPDVGQTPSTWIYHTLVVHSLLHPFPNSDNTWYFRGCSHPARRPIARKPLPNCQELGVVIKGQLGVSITLVLTDWLTKHPGEKSKPTNQPTRYYYI